MDASPAPTSPSGLPVRIENLVNRRTVEGERIEFKAGWDDFTAQAIIRTISAFANDLQNLNGGYVILGLEERDGAPVLPPVGIPAEQVDFIQQKVVESCRREIFPDYLPIIAVERFDDRTLIVLWAPAGDTKPYAAPSRNTPGKKTYYIRSGSSTVEATGDLQRQVIEMTARTPFDDRRALNAVVEDLSPALVRKYLADVRSRLADQELEPLDLYKKMRLVVPVNGHHVPRNVALLFFAQEPERFFAYPYVEVVEFADGEGGDLIGERAFHGPIHDQLRACLSYLQGLGGTLVRKVPGQAEAIRTVPYPLAAVEEALVNAFYHRGYSDAEDPVKVYLYPDRMVVTSYPGPVPGITLAQLNEGSTSAVPARNRRIGEFLKELQLAEGRGTGIKTIRRAMLEGGSPPPRFEFDETARNYFSVTLPIHPDFLVRRDSVRPVHQ